MNEDLKTAAKNVNYWAGTTTLMPLIGGFLADAYTGRFPMVLISSLVYLMVNLFMSMSYTFYFRLKEIFYANVLHFLF
jgi:peptide/histidine transporter 3/4